MKITFTEDHQSVASGNSLYNAGTQADLVQGQALIDMGVAYAGWGKPPLSVEIEASADTGIAEVVEEIADISELPLDDLTKAQLVDKARAAGISYVGLNKAQLIIVLSEVE